MQLPYPLRLHAPRLRPYLLSLHPPSLSHHQHPPTTLILGERGHPQHRLRLLQRPLQQPRLQLPHNLLKIRDTLPLTVLSPRQGLQLPLSTALVVLVLAPEFVQFVLFRGELVLQGGDVGLPYGEV
jgi:hypothetical protein